MSVIPLSAVNYPDDLPIPNMSPYDWEVGLGSTSVLTNAGSTILRRKWKHLPHIFNFNFTMSTDEMNRFIVFTDSVGADWFNIKSMSMYTGADGNIIDYQPVRFISNLGISEHGHDLWDISVQAELSPDVYMEFANRLTGGWIIAGTPASPSNNYTIIGGTPDVPLTNWIIAGTPSAPSGWV